MGLSFFETMSGHLDDTESNRHPAEFEIKAEANHLHALVRTGEARITGVMHAPPWATAAPLEGTIRILPFLGRTITYDFTFRDDQDRELRFWGQKSLSWLRPVKTMTILKSELRHGDDVLASGVLTFALGDLPSFIGSASTTTGMRALDLDAALPDGTAPASPLSEDEFTLLHAYARAAIVAGGRVPEADDATVEEAVQNLIAMPPHVRSLYRTCLHNLDRIARLRTGRRFTALDLTRQRKLVLQLADSGPAGAGITFLLGLPVKSAHYSRPDFLEGLGYPSLENPVNEPTPRWMSQVLPAEDLEADSTFECDVVVIGTGAGGGPVAALLAEAGLAVAIVEEGRYRGREDFAGDPQRRMQHMWRDGGLTTSLGRVPISLPTGRLVGGSTAINSGTCFRTPDAILNEWRTQLGFPSDFDSAAFAPWLDAVEAELEVAPGDPKYLGRIAEVVARGTEAMGGTHGPLLRNAPSCDGQGVCPVGCPTDAKRSTNVSYIPRALKASASLFTGLPVRRVLRRGREAVAVEARGQDRHGVAKVLRIKARAVVVATGTLNTPGLLRDSGVTLPWVGRNLSIHPALGMFAMFEDAGEPWKAIPQSYGAHGLMHDSVRFEGFYVPPQLSGPLMPLEGQELTRWMDQHDRVGQYGFMVRDPGAGRVMRGPGGRALIHYPLVPSVLRRLQEGASVLAELLLRGGATEVLAGLGKQRFVHTVAEAEAIRRLPLTATDYRIAAFHPLGTCRMGTDAKNSVVDFDHRVHGTNNLYVIDGSSVPTSLGVNPQVTIMAMATRAAHGLAARLA
jgi:choline dehydrogenase-like flavoprotein